MKNLWHEPDYADIKSMLIEKLAEAEIAAVDRAPADSRGIRDNMTKSDYSNRQEFEMELWPELRETWNQMIKLVFPEREASGELKQLVFTVASLLAGAAIASPMARFTCTRQGSPTRKFRHYGALNPSYLQMPSARRFACTCGRSNPKCNNA